MWTPKNLPQGMNEHGGMEKHKEEEAEEYESQVRQIALTRKRKLSVCGSPIFMVWCVVQFDHTYLEICQQKESRKHRHEQVSVE